MKIAKRLLLTYLLTMQPSHRISIRSDAGSWSAVSVPRPVVRCLIIFIAISDVIYIELNVILMGTVYSRHDRKVLRSPTKA